jgi:acid phosphatase (class A)
MRNSIAIPAFLLSLHHQTVATSEAKNFFKRKFPVAAEEPGDSYREWTCDAADRKPSALPLSSYPSGHATFATRFPGSLRRLIYSSS